jgi:hypothetical protein
MNLAKRDEQLMQIELLINAKRNMLLDKQKKLNFIVKQNRFLNEVKQDYATYYGYIIQQKQDQIKSLELLNNYINDLSVSGELSKHNIDDAKYEQGRILKEVKSIKKGLDAIISGTSDLQEKIF